MAKKEEFDKTASIGVDMARQFRMMDTLSTVMLSLNVAIPFDENNPDLRGAPTVLRDGRLFVDTATLGIHFRNAVAEKNHTLVPDVLGLQDAAKKVIAREMHTQFRETSPSSSDTELADRVQKALQSNITAAEVTQQLKPRAKNPELASTVMIERPDIKPKE